MTKPEELPFHPRSGMLPMAMSPEDFAATFPREDSLIERKSGASNREIQRAMVAFSNSEGGVILIGVADGGAVLGKPLTSGLEDAINQAAMATHGVGRYWIHELLVGSTRISVLSVARREQGFAQTSNGEVLVRRGSQNVPLIAGQLKSFMDSRALERFDVSDSGVPIDATDPRILAGVRTTYRWNRPDQESQLIDEDFAIRRQSVINLTVAGGLALLRDPASKFGKAFIEILRYPSEHADYDRRVEVRGPIQLQVVEATSFLTAELGTDLVVSGLRRYELPRLPEVVLREAIANAVAHRTYEEVGRAVEIRIYPDRIQIASPGGLLEPVTEENIRDTHSARNGVVLSHLRRFGLAEDIGRGVDVMQDEMAGALLDPPVFKNLDHSFEVTLPIRGAISPQERAWVLDVERRGGLRPADRILLVQAARGDVLTNSRVRELLSLDSRDARAALQRLRNAGFLEQGGTRGGTSYVLARALTAPPSFRLSPAELRALTLELAGDREISNADVRAATGLERLEALRLLDGLVRDGELVRSGERRGTRYRRATPEGELLDRP